jgi:NlpC/P60 family putative phage cell wall peptidase
VADARGAVIAAARAWVGTPYLHGASLCGVGADCLGLIRGVWREVYGAESETPPPYTPDWAEAGGDEALWRAARRHLTEIAPADARPGDLLLFRMREAGPAKHLGVLAHGQNGPTVVHGYERAGVVESPLGEAWARRIAAAFRFPEID